MKKMFKEKSSPAEYFPYISRGCDKECYDSLIPDWIIKFSTSRKICRNERATYQRAKDAGFGDIFVPTLYIDIPALPVNLQKKVDIEDDESFSFTCSADCDWNSSTTLVTAILQPRAEALYRRYSDDCPRSYDADSVIDFIPWTEAFINLYGQERLTQFNNYLKKEQIFDLHTGNIGFLLTEKGEPVIFDWAT